MNAIMYGKVNLLQLP